MQSFYAQRSKTVRSNLTTHLQCDTLPYERKTWRQNASRATLLMQMDSIMPTQNRTWVGSAYAD